MIKGNYKAGEGVKLVNSGDTFQADVDNNTIVVNNEGRLTAK